MFIEKLLIFDLDDTIFETKTINKKVFKPIIDEFKLLLIKEKYKKELVSQIVDDLWRYPFDQVSQRYQFNQNITGKFITLINKMKFEISIFPFRDFEIVKSLKCRKLLVTTGFENLQKAKLKALNLEFEFDKIYIDDVSDPNRIHKKGIFKKIIREEIIDTKSIYIIGDNPNSELKAGNELGLTTIQVSKLGQSKSKFADYLISDYSELSDIIRSN